MWKSILAIALGAALGALLRWFLGLKLNSLLPSIPPGTLLAKQQDWAHGGSGEGRGKVP